MVLECLRRKTRGRISFSVTLCCGVLLLASLLPGNAVALLYRTPEGSLKDNCVIWNDGTFHLFAMYRREVKPREQDQWCHVWSATSTDGVHWKDVGPVIQDAPFGIYAMRVWKAGDRFLMNHGSFTGEKQDVLRLWESYDLIHWQYLGPEYDVRRPDGERIDHMDVIPVEEAGKTVYYGYAVGGVLRSPDGVNWEWLGEIPLTGNIPIRVVQEPGGCQRIGDKFYLLVGGFYPGSFEYATSTFISESPTGPFRPDYPAFRLNGYSGRELVALWAAYCRLPEKLLLSNYMLDPGGGFWWHAPLKAAMVDAAGHLRMGYWEGNDVLKGAELSYDASQIKIEAAGPGANVESDGVQVKITAPPAPQVRWITPGKPNIAVAFFENSFDLTGGCVAEGSMTVSEINGLVFPAVGICLEQANREAVAVLFETWGQTEVGKLYLSEEPRFDSQDSTGPGCATVAGIQAREKGRFRMLIREGIFEMYLNDLLVQTFAADNLTGRIGLVVQDGQGTFECPKVWNMDLR